MGISGFYEIYKKQERQQEVRSSPSRTQSLCPVPSLLSRLSPWLFLKLPYLSSQHLERDGGRSPGPPWSRCWQRAQHRPSEEISGLLTAQLPQTWRLKLFTASSVWTDSSSQSEMFKKWSEELRPAPGLSNMLSQLASCNCGSCRSFLWGSERNPGWGKNLNNFWLALWCKCSTGGRDTIRSKWRI